MRLTIDNAEPEYYPFGFNSSILLDPFLILPVDFRSAFPFFGLSKCSRIIYYISTHHFPLGGKGRYYGAFPLSQTFFPMPLPLPTLSRSGSVVVICVLFGLCSVPRKGINHPALPPSPWGPSSPSSPLSLGDHLLLSLPLYLFLTRPFAFVLATRTAIPKAEAVWIRRSNGSRVWMTPTTPSK